jgi:hypothetical protein
MKDELNELLAKYKVATHGLSLDDLFSKGSLVDIFCEAILRAAIEKIAKSPGEIQSALLFANGLALGVFLSECELVKLIDLKKKGEIQ